VFPLSVDGLKRREAPPQKAFRLPQKERCGNLITTFLFCCERPDRTARRQLWFMAASTPGGAASALAAAGAITAEATHFVVMVTGQIESGRYEGLDSLYCRYTFSFGEDWRVVRGVEEGITQMSTARGTAADAGRLCVWNFPIDVTFKATGVHGWPQVVLSIYGSDFAGRSDMIIGYGAVHLPLTPGRHELFVRTFRPIAASLLGRFQSWLMGKRPEFRDTHFPSKGEGRDVTRVQSFGCVKIVVDVTLQGMEELGYAVPPPVRPGVRLETAAMG